MVELPAARDAGVDPTDRRLHVVGDDGVGIFLAERVSDRAETVFFGPDDETTLSAARAGLETKRVDVTDPRAPALAALADAETVIVASGSDARNVLLAQVLRVTFDVDRIVVRLSDPRNADAFEDIDVETVRVASLLTDEILDRLTS